MRADSVKEQGLRVWSGMNAAVIVALMAACLFVPGPAGAAEPRLGEFVFDDDVSAIARGPDGSLYVGGYFSRELKPTGGGLVLPATGAAVPDPASFPMVQGDVMSVAADGHGGWYIGGGFARVGNVDVRNLA